MTQPTDDSYEKQIDKEASSPPQHTKNTTSASTASPLKEQSGPQPKKLKIKDTRKIKKPGMRYHEWFPQPDHDPSVARIELGDSSYGKLHPDYYCDGTSSITFYVDGIAQPRSIPKKNINIFDVTFTDPTNIEWNEDNMPVHPDRFGTATSVIEGRKQQQHSNEKVDQ